MLANEPPPPSSNARDRSATDQSKNGGAGDPQCVACFVNVHKGIVVFLTHAAIGSYLSHCAKSFKFPMDRRTTAPASVPRHGPVPGRLAVPGSDRRRAPSVCQGFIPDVPDWRVGLGDVGRGRILRAGGVSHPVMKTAMPFWPLCPDRSSPRKGHRGSWSLHLPRCTSAMRAAHSRWDPRSS